MKTVQVSAQALHDLLMAVTGSCNCSLRNLQETVWSDDNAITVLMSEYNAALKVHEEEKVDDHRLTDECDHKPGPYLLGSGFRRCKRCSKLIMWSRKQEQWITLHQPTG